MEELYTKLKSMQRKSGWGIGIMLLFIVLAVIVLSLKGGMGLVLFIPAVIAGIIGITSYKKYTACFKENVVKAALEEVFDDVTFTPKSGIPYDVVYSTGMIQTGNRYSSNDLVAGEYKGVKFTQSDVCIEEETVDSDGNTSTTTIFQGRWMTFDFNKEFRCDLQIVSRWFGASKRKGGLFSRKENKLNKLEFENETFNKEFKVYGQNQEEAFYLITPQIMESLLNLRTTLKAPIMLMFVGGVLHIAVNNNKDAFEAKLFGKLDLDVEKQRVIADTRVITDFVDGMAMERDIYKSNI